MGDSTPEVKSLGKLTSKYLTPCRTFGLKRRNTPKSDVLKEVRSENDYSLIKNNSVNDSPVSSKVKIRRTCLSPINSLGSAIENELTPIKSFSNSSPILKLSQKKCPLINDSEKTQDTSLLQISKPETVAYTITPNKPRNFHKREPNTSEIQLSAYIKRINGKFKKLEKLKQDEIYSRKHNLTELKKSTDKWLATFKQVAASLHTELEARGRTCSLLDVLVEHNISPERVGLNAESLEFD